MYFPYLRGKQFELLALRELVSLPLNPEKISPIIEPLKREPRSIETLVKALNNNGIKVQLIVNPEYGDLKNRSEDIFALINSLTHQGYENIIPAYLIHKERDFRLLQSSTATHGYDSSGFAAIHLNQISAIPEMSTLFRNTNIINNIIHVNHLVALRRSFQKGTLAYISDPFNKKTKNSGYLEDIDENFSNDHLFYEDEGFKGYGDYLTIGSDFIDGGRLPYAVVIHLTYRDKESNNIRIRHFVSDSNEDDSDTPGKFAEALAKLIEFTDREGVDSIAVRQFKDLYNRGAYPGLGTIKKLSIMHHIELVQSLL